MPSIFPSEQEEQIIQPQIINNPIAREYAWDFDKNDFILLNGRPLIVEGVDAVKVWVYKVLQSERSKYLAYTEDYGQEYNILIGTSFNRDVVNAEAERLTKEALLIHPDITGITNFSVVLNENALHIAFTVDTVYGDSQINYEDYVI